MASKFLIYTLSDPRTDEVRYVGKSCSGMKRPRNHRSPSNIESFTHKNNWLRSIVPLKPVIEVVEEFSNPDGLVDAERFWIAQFRAWGFKLTNGTDGGDGLCGTIHSPETRARIGAGNRGKVRSEENRISISRGLGARAFVDQHGTVYQTRAEAVQRLGVHPSAVTAVLKGRRKSTGGYTFTYQTQS